MRHTKWGGTHKFRYADSVWRPGYGWTAAEWRISLILHTIRIPTRID